MKVLLSGYYGFDNLGDEALLSGIVTSLKDLEHDITVLSSQPEKTTSLHKVKAVHRYKSALSALFSCDAFISGGGGLLQDNSSRRSLQYYLWLIRLSKVLGKRTLIYGQSIGPLSDWGQKAVASALKNTRIAVRDKPSQELLASFNLTSDLVADAALLIPQPILKKENYTLLVPRHGYPNITDALISTAKTLKEHKQSVALASVQPNEDAAELERIKAVIPDIRVLDAQTPQAFLTHIAKANYVISGRLHGLILAAVAGVDYAGLIYDPKVRAFLSETGAPAFELPVDVDALNQVALNKPAVPAEKLERIKQRAQEGKMWLARALAS